MKNYSKIFSFGNDTLIFTISLCQSLVNRKVVCVFYAVTISILFPPENLILMQRMYAYTIYQFVLVSQ